MYHKNLSEIFDNTGHDTKGYPWNFNYKKSLTKTKKILYAIGDSWLFTNYFSRVMLNNYNDHLLINKSVPGLSNSMMIENLKSDIHLLERSNIDLEFIVCFSEVGRAMNDFSYSNPKNYVSTHDFFADILKNQFAITHELLKNHKHFITTAFISNNFNKNKSIIDYCRPTTSKQIDVYTVYSNGVFEYLKAKDYMFKFDFVKDIEKSLSLKSFIATALDTDITLHPNNYQPYELFIQEVFKNIHKHD